MRSDDNLATAHQTPSSTAAIEESPGSGRNLNFAQRREEGERPLEGAALLNARQVGQLLGVPESWVYREARAGRLPHLRLGRYRRFRRTQIESWLTGSCER